MIGWLSVEAEPPAEAVALVRREEAIHALLTLVGRTVPPLGERVQHGVRECEPVGRVPDALDVAQELPAVVAIVVSDDLRLEKAVLRPPIERPSF